MRSQGNFKKLQHELLPMKFDSGVECVILKHWRVHEPKQVEALLSKGILRLALTQKADALWDMQKALERTEKLHPVLAKLEAWNRLMRIEEDAAEEAKVWGMTVEEYLNRP